MHRFLRFYSLLILSAFPAMAEDVFFAPNMPDVPVTEQMMMIEDSDFSFTSDNGLMSEVIYQTPQSVSDVQKFYAETLLRAEKAKKIAEKHNLPFIPLQDKFDEAAKKAPADYWLFDGVHPTAKGHELIKTEWLKAYKNL